MLLRLSCSFRNQCHDVSLFCHPRLSSFRRESFYSSRHSPTPYTESSTTYLIGRHPSPESELLSRMYSNLRFRSRLRRLRLHIKKESPSVRVTDVTGQQKKDPITMTTYRQNDGPHTFAHVSSVFVVSRMMMMIE